MTKEEKPWVCTGVAKDWENKDDAEKKDIEEKIHKVVESPGSVSAAENECVNCHTSAKKLVKITRTLAKEKPAVNKVESKGPGWGGEVEPLALHERVFVDEDLFDDETHGDIACQDCHGGNPGYHPDWCAHVR